MDRAIASAGRGPKRLVTLELRGRRTGRLVSFPVVVADHEGERYLVAMLGEGANWVAIVRAAGGRAVLRHGSREAVRLEEVNPSSFLSRWRREGHATTAPRSSHRRDRRDSGWASYDRCMLCGRDPERTRIGRLLDDARKSHVLVICGEPGVGKSALLEDARERATDMRVLSSRGVESEAQLPFAALHQIVRPIIDDLESVPAPQAGALRGALGLAAGGSDDRFLVSLAVLSLLAESAERQPLLCLVDDAHWLDDASAEALVFVARRLEAEGIVMLFAAREGEPRRFEAPGLPTLQLGGLDHAPAAELIDRSAGVPLTSEIRDRLVVR